MRPDPDVCGTRLRLTLRATRDPSPISSGYEVAKASRFPLGPGETYSPNTFTADYTQPPAGTYCMHLIPSEAPNETTPLDYYTLPGTETFNDTSTPEGSGGGGGAVDGALLALLAACRLALQVGGRRRAG